MTKKLWGLVAILSVLDIGGAYFIYGNKSPTFYETGCKNLEVLEQEKFPSLESKKKYIFKMKTPREVLSYKECNN